MSNRENNILKQLIADYGLEKTISFCEMSAFVYGEMYKDICDNPMDNQELVYEYDYQRWRWQQTLDELIGKEIYSEKE